MFNSQKHRAAGQSQFVSSIDALATILSIILTFVLGPMAYDVSAHLVQEFTAHHYGYGWESLVAFVWFIVCILSVFFFFRASVSTGMKAGSAAIATRIF